MKPAQKLLERTATVVKGKLLTEVVEKRLPHSKTFQLDPHTFHVSQRLRPVHYRDDSGQWDEIDTDVDSNFRVEKAPYKLRLLPAGKIGYRYTSRQNGGWMEMELVSLDGQPVGNVQRRRDGDKVRWQVAPGVEMYLQALPDHPEIFKVYDAPHTTVWRITDSGDFPGRFNPNTSGKDAAGDNLELATSFADGIFTETWTGRVSRVPEGEKRRRLKQWFSDPALPVLVDAAITENIGFDVDDAQNIVSSGAGAFETSNDFVIISKYRGSTSDFSQFAGFRFRTVALPVGATITSAILTLNVIALETPSIKFYGNDVDNAGVWATNNRPSNITKTTAAADFAPVSTGIKTIDVTTIIAEIGARAAWASNNALALAGFPQGTFATGSTTVKIEDFNAVTGATGYPALTGTDEAQLDITYTVASSGGSAATAILHHRRRLAGH